MTASHAAWRSLIVPRSPEDTGHEAGALAASEPPCNVLVTAKFPPEEFHIRLFQQVGNMRGVKGSTAKLAPDDRQN